jgi:hypothetical protein
MTVVTRPAIIARVSCHSDAYWLEFNVSDAVEQVDIVLCERGPESTLEQRTWTGVLEGKRLILEG